MDDCGPRLDQKVCADCLPPQEEMDQMEKKRTDSHDNYSVKKGSCQGLNNRTVPHAGAARAKISQSARGRMLASRE